MPDRRPRNVIVTGASAGVGRAAAVAFARRGDNVGLIARGAEGLEGARADVIAAGGRAVTLPADVSDAAAVQDAADSAARELGPLDIWVNAAMVTVFAPFAQLSADEFRRVTEVTYLGQVFGTMAALRHMGARNRGTIVQVGSALAYRGLPLQAAYCGAKHAIRGFTDALRSELIHEGSGIRLTMVQLPAVNTPQFDWARNRLSSKPQPLPPIFNPEVAARAIVKAADQAPRELWVGSSSLKVILGSMVAPGWLDRILARQGYQGQQSGEPADPARPDNLFTSVPEDHGMHGRFDARTTSNAFQISGGAARTALAAAAVGLALTAFGLSRTRRRQPRR